MRFLDTRGMDEPGYDPAEDLARFNDQAHVLIVNHALFFTDLAVRRAGGNILPDYQVVIFDEAHTIEDVAAEHLGVTLAQGGVQRLLGRICYGLSGLVDAKMQQAQSDVLAAAAQMTPAQLAALPLVHLAGDMGG